MQEVLSSGARYNAIDSGEDPDVNDDDDCCDVTGSSVGIQSPVIVQDRTGTDGVTQPKFAGEQIDLKTFWPAFLDHLICERPNMGAFLSLACAFHSGENVIDLKFSSVYRFQYLEITRKNNRDEIELHLKQFAGRELELNITLESKPIENNQQNFIHAIGNVPSTIDDEIEREPIIKTILDIFDGEVLN